MVQNRRASRRQATSDWLAIEQQRGISVTSTVLQFPYRGFHLNLLDTPGHQDFSEDTYRTLAAADNAVMIIDANWGLGTSVVEGQVSPDHFVVDKVKQQVVEETRGAKHVSVWLDPEGVAWIRTGPRAVRCRDRERRFEPA